MRSVKKIYGPYLNKGGRKEMSIFYTDGSHGTMLLSRFKMEKKLGRKLKRNEHVDHKDENKTNDRVANLQILSPSKHAKKTWDRSGLRKGFDTYACAFCNELFDKQICKEEERIRRKRSGPFCSRTCSARFTLQKRWHA